MRLFAAVLVLLAAAAPAAAATDLRLVGAPRTTDEIELRTWGPKGSWGVVVGDDGMSLRRRDRAERVVREVAYPVPPALAEEEPPAIGVAPDGSFYTADGQGLRKWSPDGRLRSSWAPGPEVRRIDGVVPAENVAVDGRGRIVLALRVDGDASQVVRLAPDGRLLQVLAPRLVSEVNVRRVPELAVSARGAVAMVVERVADRFVVFDAGGRRVSLTSPTPRVRDVAFAGEQLVLAASIDQKRVLVAAGLDGEIAGRPVPISSRVTLDAGNDGRVHTEEERGTGYASGTYRLVPR